jgi:hypothetical protein
VFTKLTKGIYMPIEIPSPGSYLESFGACLIGGFVIGVLAMKTFEIWKKQYNK